MIPFIFSIFLYLIITPVIHFFKKKFKLSSSIALLCSVITIGIGFLIITFLTSSSIHSFMKGADQYTQKVEQAIVSTENIAEKYGFNLKEFNLKEKVQELPILSFFQKLTKSFISGFSSIVLILIFTLFLLTGESISDQKIATLEEIKSSISKYIRSKILISLATAFLTYLILLISGSDLAIMFSMLTFLFNFIPNIGSIIAVLLPIPVLLLQFGLGWQTPFAIAFMTLVQIIIGNILEPKIMGESMGLHPITILLFLAFWGFIWGIPGMFLSVPISVAIKIILAKFNMTQPIANLLEGKVKAN